MVLSGADRAFFALLADAAFANPFSEDRDRIDRRLAGARRGDDAAAILERLLARVRDRLDSLGAKPLDVQPEADRRLVEQAVLFALFHRVAARFDALIQAQLAQGGDRAPVRFGEETLAALVSAGFTPQVARHHFALFFQLRRAFYFIAQTLPGASPSMRRLRERLWSNVFTADARLYARHLWRRMEDFSTLLLGETGTGKGIAAAAIGRSGFIPYDEKSQAFTESFVGSFLSINLAQFPETLIESELFGHKRGAFTGATEGHVGLFARCSPHGAIFIDEIGEVGIPIQIKLLRVLQDRAFSPVGGHELARFSGRVVAATNRSLADLRARGHFRDDFYYRLCSDVIDVPSLAARLREDPAELDTLLAFILGRILGDDSPEMRATARAAIDRDLGPEYAWPGNVRELEQCVRRLILTGSYRGDPGLPRRAAGDTGVDSGARLLDVAGDDGAKALLARYCQALYARYGTYEEVARRAGLDRRTVKAQLALANGLVSRPGPTQVSSRRAGSRGARWRMR